MFTISTGTDPANKLWYIDAAALPVNAKTGAMDLTPYDRQKGAAAKPLPIVKLIDDFRASFSVIANDGACLDTLHRPQRHAQQVRPQSLFNIADPWLACHVTLPTYEPPLQVCIGMHRSGVSGHCIQNGGCGA